MHEEKYCPRCKALFECKVGNILQCQCYGISLNEDEKQLIASQYNDCLCRSCLADIKNSFPGKAKELPL